MKQFQKFKAIIIDDSPQARKLLRLMVQELTTEVEIINEAGNVAEAFLLVKENEPDIIFLDIEMPGKSGIQLAEELIAEKIKSEIIFTTAYNEYAIKAFRLSAIDYLLKPVNENQLLEAISKVKEKKELEGAQVKLQALNQNLRQERGSVLCVPVTNGYEYMTLSDIEYIEADGAYVHIYLSDQKHKTVSKNLKYIENALEGASDFLRVHRSFIINVKRIARYSKSGRGTLLMKSGKEIDIARERKQEVLQVLDSISS